MPNPKPIGRRPKLKTADGGEAKPRNIRLSDGEFARVKKFVAWIRGLSDQNPEPDAKD